MIAQILSSHTKFQTTNLGKVDSAREFHIINRLRYISIIFSIKVKLNIKMIKNYIKYITVSMSINETK